MSVHTFSEAACFSSISFMLNYVKIGLPVRHCDAIVRLLWYRSRFTLVNIVSKLKLILTQP